MTLVAAQVRQACALLLWNSPTLAEQTRVAYQIVCSAWRDNSVEAISDADQQAIRAALEKAGVRFTVDAEGYHSVVLAKAAPCPPPPTSPSFVTSPPAPTPPRPKSAPPAA